MTSWEELLPSDSLLKSWFQLVDLLSLTGIETSRMVFAKKWQHLTFAIEFRAFIIRGHWCSQAWLGFFEIGASGQGAPLCAVQQGPTISIGAPLVPDHGPQLAPGGPGWGLSLNWGSLTPRQISFGCMRPHMCAEKIRYGFSAQVSKRYSGGTAWPRGAWAGAPVAPPLATSLLMHGHPLHPCWSWLTAYLTRAALEGWGGDITSPHVFSR